MLEKIKEIMKDTLNIDVENVTEETYFVDDLRLDSLDVMELIVNFENEFGIQINDEELESVKQIKDVMKYIELAK